MSIPLIYLYIHKDINKIEFNFLIFRTCMLYFFLYFQMFLFIFIVVNAFSMVFAIDVMSCNVIIGW